MTTPVRLHPVNVRNYGSQSRLTLPDIKVAGWTLCTTRQDFEQLAIVRTHKGTRHFVSPHLIRDWDVSDFLGRPEISPLCHVKGESQPIKRYKLVDWLFRSTLSIHRVNPRRRILPRLQNPVSPALSWHALELGRYRDPSFAGGISGPTLGRTLRSISVGSSGQRNPIREHPHMLEACRVQTTTEPVQYSSDIRIG